MGVDYLQCSKEKAFWESVQIKFSQRVVYF